MGAAAKQWKEHIAGRIEGVLSELRAEGESGEHRDVTLLLSLPGAGRVVAATMLAEVVCRHNLVASLIHQRAMYAADRAMKARSVKTRVRA